MQKSSVSEDVGHFSTQTDLYIYPLNGVGK